MIAMSAAAMAALCAQAGVPDGYTSGIDFEDTATGYLDVTLDDSNSSAAGAKLWSSAAAKTDGTVDSMVEQEQNEGKTNTYLKIDETAVLTRASGLVNEKGQPVSAIPTGGNITIATKVQFTAADDKPTVSEGDKILVWAKAPTDGDEDQNIYICITDGTATEENPYIVTEKAVQVDTWYDLKIVAKVGGSELEPVTVFDVIVDGATIATDCRSMVTTGDAATTISSIGFQGTGAVDDIGFKTLAAAGKFIVSVTATGTTDFGMGDNMDREANYTVGTQNVQIYVGTKLGEVVSCNIEGAEISTRDAEGYVTVTIPTATIADKATVNVVITVTAGSGTSLIVPTIDPSTAVVTGVPNDGFKIGTEYDTANITASPSAAHKTATVVVKVNGETVSGKFTLAAGDKVTITVTEDDITFALTLPTVTGATAAVTAGGETVADIAKIVEGTEVTVTWTADEGYKITAGETQTITMTADVTATAPTVQAITYATITVVKDDGVESVTLTVGDKTIDPANYKADVDDAVVVTVAYTLKSGKVLADDCTVPQTVTLTENRTITIKTKDEQGGETWPESWKVPESATADQFTAYQAWAAKEGNDATAKNAMEAFLMGVDLKDHTPFAADSIAIVNGKVVVTTNAGAKPNGVIYVKYGSTVACNAGVAAIVEGEGLPATAPAQFYKVCIDFAMPSAE